MPRETTIDRSEDVSAIVTRKGPTMIDCGVSQQQQANAYVDRLIALVKWSQENNCGISWA